MTWLFSFRLTSFAIVWPIPHRTRKKYTLFQTNGRQNQYKTWDWFNQNDTFGETHVTSKPVTLTRLLVCNSFYSDDYSRVTSSFRAVALLLYLLKHTCMDQGWNSCHRFVIPTYNVKISCHEKNKLQGEIQYRQKRRMEAKANWKRRLESWKTEWKWFWGEQTETHICAIALWKPWPIISDLGFLQVQWYVVLNRPWKEMWAW